MQCPPSLRILLLPLSTFNSIFYCKCVPTRVRRRPSLLVRSRRKLLPTILPNLRIVVLHPSVLISLRGRQSLRLSFPISARKSSPRFSKKRCFPLPLFLPNCSTLPRRVFFPLHLLLPSILEGSRLGIRPISSPVLLRRSRHSRLRRWCRACLVFLFPTSRSNFRSSHRIRNHCFHPDRVRRGRRDPARLPRFPTTCNYFHLREFRLLRCEGA